MRVTRMGAIGSLLLAVAAGLGLAVCHQGVEAAGGGVPERQFCESLVEAHAMSVLGVLILPVLLGWCRAGCGEQASAPDPGCRDGGLGRLLCPGAGFGWPVLPVRRGRAGHRCGGLATFVIPAAGG